LLLCENEIKIVKTTYFSRNSVYIEFHHVFTTGVVYGVTITVLWVYYTVAEGRNMYYSVELSQLHLEPADIGNNSHLLILLK